MVEVDRGDGLADEPWPRSPAEAKVVQESLRKRVIREDRFDRLESVAGLDAHYGGDGRVVWAAAALMTPPTLELEESALVCCQTPFPYVPGFLSFRETPAMLAALKMLPAKPDLLFIDGQGVAHPRRFGLACHVGVLADIPTIGVAKSRLIGTHDEPGIERGAKAALKHRDEVIGAVVRTQRQTHPLFVSVGHRISLETAIKQVLACSPRFRLAEPIRAADRLSRTHD
jgi:deoxyribonuclease V